MAIISDSTKIDKAFKFVSGKGYTTSQKGVDNEDAASGFIIGTSFIFSQDAAIPTTAPGASTSVLTYYDDGTGVGRFPMVYDVSSPLNRAWYASTNGSTLTTMRATRIQNWVPPAFGNYTIRMFLVGGSSPTAPYLQEIFFSDSTSPLFDYKTGILTFESDPLAAYAGIPGGPPVGIHISGYVYTGPLLSQVFDGNGNFTGGLSDFGTSTSLAKFINPNKSFEVSSPFAIGTGWVSETSAWGTTGITWTAVGQFPDGKTIIMGFNSIPSTTIIGAYSYGHGNWRKTASLAGIFTTTPYAIWCGDDNLTAYAIDSSGKVARSLDGGISWSLLSTLGFNTFGVWGSSTTDVYIVGAGGNIVHSTGGGTWTAQTNADSHDLFAVHGSSSGDVYAVGAAGTVRHTTGSGTWTGQTQAATANDLYTVFAVSSTEVYAGGAGPSTLIKSTSGTWANFNSGIGSVDIENIYVIANGTQRNIYATATWYAGHEYIVFKSTGANSWTIEKFFTFSGAGIAFVSAGGTSGVFGAMDVGRIAALHKYPVEDVHGHMLVDGYLSANGSIFGQYGEFNTLGVVQPTSSAIGSSYPAITVTAPSSTTYVIMSGTSVDQGEGFRFWRDNTNSYTLEVGSKATTNFDGTTPIAVGGRLRLGGFTTSPSTTSRGEIETVSSVGMRMAAYQGDMTIANAFGVSGSTKGDVSITTQNGAINLTAVGTESPSLAGRIVLTPGTGSAAYVMTGTNTTSTFLKVLSPSGNYNLMDGTGSFSNTGSISAGTTLHSATSTSVGTSLSVGTTIAAGAGIASGGGSPSGNKIECYNGDINVWGGGNIYNNTGPIIANTSYVRAGAYLQAGTYVTAAGPVYAQNGFSGSLRMDAAVASTGAYHYGLWVTVTGLFSAAHNAAWGLGQNPCPANTYFDVVCTVSARLSGVGGVLVYTDHDILPTKRDQDAYWPGGSFGNEFMIMLEWHMASTTGTGFTYGGRVVIY